MCEFFHVTGACCRCHHFQVLAELKEYATEVDVDFVRKAVRAIGRCAIKVEVRKAFSHDKQKLNQHGHLCRQDVKDKKPGEY